MKEFLQKRYKDYMSDRILKSMLSFFNNFIINLDFGNYCDAIEGFVNQDEFAMKKFVFRCFDANGSGKLSEQDLFKVMKTMSP
jgi:Ca2+-binding EF-hand superfamily protein